MQKGSNNSTWVLQKVFCLKEGTDCLGDMSISQCPCSGWADCSNAEMREAYDSFKSWEFQNLCV